MDPTGKQDFNQLNGLDQMGNGLNLPIVGSGRPVEGRKKPAPNGCGACEADANSSQKTTYVETRESKIRLGQLERYGLAPEVPVGFYDSRRQTVAFASGFF